MSYLSTLTWREKRYSGANGFRGVWIECIQVAEWKRFNGIKMPTKN